MPEAATERKHQPLQQIAAALLSYTGVISAAEARELAGFLPEGPDSRHTKNMRILAQFMKDTGKAIPPILANWWPGSGQ